MINKTLVLCHWHVKNLRLMLSRWQLPFFFLKISLVSSLRSVEEATIRLRMLPPFAFLLVILNNYFWNRFLFLQVEYFT